MARVTGVSRSVLNVIVGCLVSDSLDGLVQILRIGLTFPDCRKCVSDGFRCTGYGIRSSRPDLATRRRPETSDMRSAKHVNREKHGGGLNVGKPVAFSTLGLSAVENYFMAHYLSQYLKGWTNISR